MAQKQTDGPLLKWVSHLQVLVSIGFMLKMPMNLSRTQPQSKALVNLFAYYFFSLWSV